MSFPNKMLTRQEAINRYGAIDFASRHWAGQSSWIKMLEIPTGMFPLWKVLDTKIPVTHIACNVDIHMPLMAALKSVKDAGMDTLLHTFDGCFNIRMVRGSNTAVSAHSYGLAIDLNASENPLGSTQGGFYNHPGFVKCFTDKGFSWGGSWTHRRDSMHFSYCWE